MLLSFGSLSLPPLRSRFELICQKKSEGIYGDFALRQNRVPMSALNCDTRPRRFIPIGRNLIFRFCADDFSASKPLDFRSSVTNTFAVRGLFVGTHSRRQVALRELVRRHFEWPRRHEHFGCFSSAELWVLNV